VRLTRYNDLEWEPRRALSDRDGRSSSEKTLSKVLHRGTPGEPGHFEMSVTTYTVPKKVVRHRHDTDQFRLSLVGESPWAPGHVTPEGALLFVPSGTPYGPYERPVGIELLQVEFEGADGAPFADIDQLVDTKERLARQGTFDDGMFRWIDAEGVEQRKPEFRAVLEEATGRPQTMPRTRYSVPIEIIPEHFAWAPVAPHAWVREFVLFPERRTRAWQLAVGRGGTLQVVADQVTLLFVSAGSGSVDGVAVGERDSVRLDSGDTIEVAADERIELFGLDLPQQMRNEHSESIDSGRSSQQNERFKAARV
jgi:hypothetical protein